MYVHMRQLESSEDILDIFNALHDSIYIPVGKRKEDHFQPMLFIIFNEVQKLQRFFFSTRFLLQKRISVKLQISRKVIKIVPSLYITKSFLFEIVKRKLLFLVMLSFILNHITICETISFQGESKKGKICVFVQIFHIDVAQ